MAKYRKTQAVLRAEYTQVLDMLSAGTTALEIQAALGLSPVQLRAHLAKAILEGHSVTPALHITVRASAMPEAVRSFFAAGKGDIFKIEPPDGNGAAVITLIRCKPDAANASTEEEIDSEIDTDLV